MMGQADKGSMKNKRQRSTGKEVGGQCREGHSRQKELPMQRLGEEDSPR